MNTQTKIGLYIDLLVMEEQYKHAEESLNEITYIAPFTFDRFKDYEQYENYLNAHNESLRLNYSDRIIRKEYIGKAIYRIKLQLKEIVLKKYNL